MIFLTGATQCAMIPVIEEKEISFLLLFFPRDYLSVIMKNEQYTSASHGLTHLYTGYIFFQFESLSFIDIGA